MFKIINEGNGINLNNKMVSNEKMQKYQRKMLDRIWTLIYVMYRILKYAMKLSNHIFFTRFYNVHQCFALYDTIMKYLQSFTIVPNSTGSICTCTKFVGYLLPSLTDAEFNECRIVQHSFQQLLVFSLII